MIFDAPGRPPPVALSAELAAALTEALGFEVPVYLRAADAVRAITLERPFSPAELEASGGKHQVILLSAAPSATIREQALELASAEDRLQFGDRELHWLPNAGVSGSDLDLKALAALLGPSTVRTLNTINRITDRFLS